MNYFYNILNNNEEKFFNNIQENIIKEDFSAKKTFKKVKKGAKKTTNKVKKGAKKTTNKVGKATKNEKNILTDKKEKELEKNYKILKNKYLIEAETKNKLKNKYLVQEENNTRLENKLITQEGKIISLKNTIKTDQKKLELIPKLKNTIKNKNSKIKKLNKNINKEKRIINRLNKKINLKNIEISNIENNSNVQEEDIFKLNNKINSKNKIISQANDVTNNYKNKYNETNKENTELKRYIQQHNVNIQPQSKNFFKNNSIDPIETFKNPKVRINGKNFYKCQVDDEGNHYKNCINDFNVINNGIPSIYQNINPPLQNKLYEKNFSKIKSEQIVSPLCPNNYDLQKFGEKYLLCQNDIQEENSDDNFCIPYDMQKILSNSDYTYLQSEGFKDCDYGDEINSLLIQDSPNNKVFNDELECKKWCIDNPECMAISITRDSDNVRKCNLYKFVKTNDGTRINPKKSLVELNISKSYLKKNDTYVYNLNKKQLNNYYQQLKYGDCVDTETFDYDDYCKKYGKSYYPKLSSKKNCPERLYGNDKYRVQCLNNYSLDKNFEIPPITEPFVNNSDYKYILILLFLVLVIILLKKKKII
jgi:hypothetical protein